MSRILLLVPLSITFIIGVSLLFVLLKYVYHKLQKYFFEAKSFLKDRIDKQKASKARGGKYYIYKIKSSVKALFYYIKSNTITNYFLNHPTEAFFIFFMDLELFSFFLCIANFNFIPKTVYNYIQLYLVITALIMFFWFPRMAFTSKDLSSKLYGLFGAIIMSLFASSIPIILILDLIGRKTLSNVFVYTVSVLFFFLYALTYISFVIISTMRGFKSSAFKAAWAFILCVYLYLFGGLVFGAYIYTMYPSVYASFPYGKLINGLLNSSFSVSKMYYLFWNYIKIGMEGFFSYPPSNIRCTFTICQYFIGKYIELVLIALVVTNIISLSSPKEEKQDAPPA